MGAIAARVGDRLARALGVWCDGLSRGRQGLASRRSVVNISPQRDRARASHCERTQGLHRSQNVPRRTTDFDHALLALIGYWPRDWPGRKDGRHAAMVKALENRVPYSTIRNWRRQHRCKPPAWAIDLVRNKLRAQHESALRGLDEIKRAVPGRGQAWQRKSAP